jgi:hypothetical protein
MSLYPFPGTLILKNRVSLSKRWAMHEQQHSDIVTSYPFHKFIEPSFIDNGIPNQAIPRIVSFGNLHLGVPPQTDLSSALTVTISFNLRKLMNPSSHEVSFHLILIYFSFL